MAVLIVIKRYYNLILSTYLIVSTVTTSPQFAQIQSTSNKSSLKNQGVPNNTKQRLARLETQLEDLRELLAIPGMSAAVVKDQKLIWAHGFGFADNERRIPAAENTPYRIASLTKTPKICSVAFCLT
jgi:CubicO group peptidase (beta-lactamase class C family)